MHLLLSAEDSHVELRSELADAFPPSAVGEWPHGFSFEAEIVPGRQLPYLAFAQQLLPNAMPGKAGSIRAWAELLFEAVKDRLPEDRPWRLQVSPKYSTVNPARRIGARAWHSARKYAAAEPRPEPGPGSSGDPDAGRNRCRLIREALLELLGRKRRHLRRGLNVVSGPFNPLESLVQVILLSPEEGFISIAPAPLPRDQDHLVSPFPLGEVAPAVDKSAPSRAFAKLLEAQARAGFRVAPGECCVDLGAAPGSWTFMAVAQGGRVLALDRAPLRDDLMRHPAVRYQTGDAFAFKPSRPVDWLLCDVIAVPERTADLLLEWLRRGWCRNFVVTVKMNEASGMAVLRRLKAELPGLTSRLWLTRLCANKKEICAFGIRQMT